jgi:hypothetical protein
LFALAPRRCLGLVGSGSLAFGFPGRATAVQPAARPGAPGQSLRRWLHGLGLVTGPRGAGSRPLHHAAGLFQDWAVLDHRQHRHLHAGVVAGADFRLERRVSSDHAGEGRRLEQAALAVGPEFDAVAEGRERREFEPAAVLGLEDLCRRGAHWQRV